MPEARDDKKGMGAVLYLRLSREDGEHGVQSESICNQRELLQRYAAEHGFQVGAEYIDDGYSGTNFERPAFLRLLRDIENGRIETVLTKDLSRLGRDYIGTGHYLERYFPEHGVRYIAVNDGVDTKLDGGGNDITPFRAVINDLYARDISKKVRTALDTKRACGKFIGARAPYGYRKSPSDKNRLEPYEPEARWVRELFCMFLGGESLRGIAQRLTQSGAPPPNARYGALAWNDATVRRMLMSPVYAGDLAQGRTKKAGYKVKRRIAVPRSEWMVVCGTHEGIISHNDFDEVQILLRRRANHARSARAAVHPLAGLVRCGACGSAMTLLRQGKREYFVCSGWKRGMGCTTSRCIRADMVLQAVLSALQSELSTVEEQTLVQRLMELRRVHAPSENILQRAVEENHAAALCLYRDRASGIVPEQDYIRFAQVLRKEEEDLQRRLTSSKKSGQQDEAGLQAKVHRLISIELQQKGILTLLLKNVAVEEDHKLTICFAFARPTSSG